MTDERSPHRGASIRHERLSGQRPRAEEKLEKLQILQIKAELEADFTRVIEIKVRGYLALVGVLLAIAGVVLLIAVVPIKFNRDLLIALGAVAAGLGLRLVVDWLRTPSYDAALRAIIRRPREPTRP
ncbi:MAG TPA: hypothetical protein VIT45_08455 [Allosphingosinicella sp.]